MVTIKEIAKECNVSITTVSNVLNGKAKVGEKTKQRVLEVVQKRGYRPNSIAQGLRMQRTRTIGIIAEDIAQFTTPAIVEGIMSYCERRGYRIIVKNLRMYARWQDAWYNDVGAYHSILDPTLEELFSIMVDGVVYIAGHARYIDCFPQGFRVPAVMAYAYAQNPQVPSVLMDDELAAYQLIKYVIGKGHRKIGVIGGRADNIHTQRRLLGYQRALFEEKILFDPGRVRYANWDKESAYQVADELLRTDVTAIFCNCDRMAGGLYLRMHELGMRPGQDMSVIGFDNQEISEYFTPGLTTMALPLGEIGRVSAQLLMNQIEGEEEIKQEDREVLIPCSFVERNSVQPVAVS